MRTRVRGSFERDVRKFVKKNKRRTRYIERAIDDIRVRIEGMTSSQALSRLNDVKKLSNSTEYYRVRIGDYRIGLQVTDGGDAVEFVRFLHRRDFYRHFPRR